MTPDEKLCSPSLLSKLQLLSLPTIQASHHKLLNSDYPRQPQKPAITKAFHLLITAAMQ
jgi:hypothetical protein